MVKWWYQWTHPRIAHKLLKAQEAQKENKTNQCEKKTKYINKPPIWEWLYHLFWFIIDFPCFTHINLLGRLEILRAGYKKKKKKNMLARLDLAWSGKPLMDSYGFGRNLLSWPAAHKAIILNHVLYLLQAISHGTMGLIRYWTRVSRGVWCNTFGGRVF